MLLLLLIFVANCLPVSQHIGISKKNEWTRSPKEINDHISIRSPYRPESYPSSHSTAERPVWPPLQLPAVRDEGPGRKQWWLGHLSLAATESQAKRLNQKLHSHLVLRGDSEKESKHKENTRLIKAELGLKFCERGSGLELFYLCTWLLWVNWNSLPNNFNLIFPITELMFFLFFNIPMETIPSRSFSALSSKLST